MLLAVVPVSKYVKTFSTEIWTASLTYVAITVPTSSTHAYTLQNNSRKTEIYKSKSPELPVSSSCSCSRRICSATPIVKMISRTQNNHFYAFICVQAKMHTAITLYHLRCCASEKNGEIVLLIANLMAHSKSRSLVSYSHFVVTIHLSRLDSGILACDTQTDR